MCSNITSPTPSRRMPASLFTSNSEASRWPSSSTVSSVKAFTPSSLPMRKSTSAANIDLPMPVAPMSAKSGRRHSGGFLYEKEATKLSMDWKLRTGSNAPVSSSNANSARTCSFTCVVFSLLRTAAKSRILASCPRRKRADSSSNCSSTDRPTTRAEDYSFAMARRSMRSSPCPTS